MECFIYKGDIYCEDCGRAIRRAINKEGGKPAGFPDESTYESDEYPKGPYPQEESDGPDHCGACHAFLENPLTSDGVRYLRDAIKNGKGLCTELWADFYSDQLNQPEPISLEYHRNDDFTTAYVECALWTSTDDDDEPLEDNYGWSDIAPEALTQMIEDCRDFQESFGELFHYDPIQAGHNLWLTRNDHGAGFWDGYYDYSTASIDQSANFGDGNVGTILTDASKTYGSQDLYVGDDGKIYLS